MSDRITESGIDPAETQWCVRLAQCFVALADILVADYDVVDLLNHLVESSVGLLDVSQAGLMLIDQHDALQLAPPRARRPGSSSYSRSKRSRDHASSASAAEPPSRWRTSIQATRDRWPHFTDAATAAGFQSVHAVPLRIRDETIGGLNLFNSAQRPQLSSSEQQTAQALADTATIGILQQWSVHRSFHLAEQLQAALTTRIAVEQAKGVLAEHGQIDMDTAFVHLRAFARKTTANSGSSRLRSWNGSFTKRS